MLAGSGAGMGTRSGAGRAGNGTGLNSLNTAGPGPNPGSETDGGQFENREYSTEVVYSGSDQDSDSADDEDTTGSCGDRRGVKRERSEREVGHHTAPASGGLSGGYGGVSPGVPGAKPGKKTRGRVKIKMEFIDNKLRRYTTFSKRKTGIMKKAYELSTLTGTQVLLLVASETGHVYTFATRKLQPMITSETGKALIQTCLNSPDSPPRSDPSSDQRMSATGFEETDLTYQVSEADGCSEVAKVFSGGVCNCLFLLSPSCVPAGSHQASVHRVQPARHHPVHTFLLVHIFILSIHAGADQHHLLAATHLHQRDSAEDVHRCCASWKLHLDARCLAATRHTHHPSQPAAGPASGHPGPHRPRACCHAARFIHTANHAAPPACHCVTVRRWTVSAAADHPGAAQQSAGLHQSELPRYPQPHLLHRRCPAGLPHPAASGRCSDPGVCGAASPDGDQPAEQQQQQPDGAAGRQPGCPSLKRRLTDSLSLTHTQLALLWSSLFSLSLYFISFSFHAEAMHFLFTPVCLSSCKQCRLCSSWSSNSNSTSQPLVSWIIWEFCNRLEQHET
ncbi:serum response factor-like isoform X1 [Mastacembelus armatus]|uniref:serum response factor-like isoform X1 n=1 Tax=Mastacembelus armatus TaxID=205130 RepID=UPI000E45C379|nr:serum response factor-like isoform X1 [Mastacembelus armatus]